MPASYDRREDLRAFRAPLRAARLEDLPAFLAARRPFRAVFLAARLVARPALRAVRRPLRALFRAARLADLPPFLAAFLLDFLAAFRRGRALSGWLGVGSSKPP